MITVITAENHDYLPSRIRVLSSESAGKLEPDLVTTPFDTDLVFTDKDRDYVYELKDIHGVLHSALDKAVAVEFTAKNYSSVCWRSPIFAL